MHDTCLIIISEPEMVPGITGTFGDDVLTIYQYNFFYQYISVFPASVFNVLLDFIKSEPAELIYWLIARKEYNYGNDSII